MHSRKWKVGMVSPHLENDSARRLSLHLHYAMRFFHTHLIESNIIVILYYTAGENGFIPMDKLGGVLDELDLTAKVGGDAGVSTLKAYLEVGYSRSLPYVHKLLIVFLVHRDLIQQQQQQQQHIMILRRLAERVSSFGMIFGRHAVD